MSHHAPHPEDIVLPPFLYRYSKFSKNFYKSICSQELYFSNPTTFSDPFEPSVLIMDNTSEKFLANFLKNTIMACLCTNWNNPKLWSYYADGLRGICIGFEINLLINNLCDSIQEKYESQKKISEYCLTTNWLWSFYVNYAEHNIPLNLGLFLASDHKENIKFFATKSILFDGENEFRLAILPKTYRDPEDKNSEPKFISKDQGFKYKKSTIKRVIFGERADVADIKAVKKLLGDDISYHKAIAIPEDYSIKIEPPLE